MHSQWIQEVPRRWHRKESWEREPWNTHSLPPSLSIVIYMVDDVYLHLQAGCIRRSDPDVEAERDRAVRCFINK